jgi:hypothetical protein
MIAALLLTAFAQVEFTVRSARDGAWSSPQTWEPARVPGAGDRVLVSRGTRVVYDVQSDAVLRLIQVAGTLSFARDRGTLLNVGLIKVQNSDACSEDGFACDFDRAGPPGEPKVAPVGGLPALEVGTAEEPIPPEHRARIRLHFLEGMNADDAPAIACCSARMDVHGAPMSRTWVKLGADARPGDRTVTLAEEVSGWRAGDEIIVTGSAPRTERGDRRPSTEERRIEAIDGRTLRLDRPLETAHAGSGEFRSEVADLSRNVVIESADPDGVRGHTVYHRFSRGGISYARFAHLGKQGRLGRYAIHFHLLDDTMRGGGVVGAAIVDSHNRWITIHGTDYLLVRDCVGYRSVGHGFFLEDATEVYNVLDRNLGVQARSGRRLPKQVLDFDPNDGAAFWWANGRNAFARNVACENDQYGYRYDMQKSSKVGDRLPVRMPDGSAQEVDVRTIPIWRFQDNESHTEGLYGMLVAADGGHHQPDTPIRDAAMLAQIRRLDWTGPDARHPHRINGLKIWEAHYAFRPHIPNMLIEGLRIDRSAYGIYRPAFDGQVFRDVYLSRLGPEPFNRGMDDASAQAGAFSVDGLILERMGAGSQEHPIVHMTDNGLADRAEAHFRGVVIRDCDPRRPVFNRGGSVRADPFVERGVPYFIHDYFGAGRHARIVSTRAKDLYGDGAGYRAEPPLTGDESRLTEVSDVPFPKLLDPVDDQPPATIVTSVRRRGDRLVVRGVSTDDGKIVSVRVNGREALQRLAAPGVVDWEIELEPSADGAVEAGATDEAGNRELTPHRVTAR